MTTLKNITNCELFNYSNYSNNYGTHCQGVKIGNKIFYFSYETLIAFKGENSQGKYFNCIIQNYGNTTTGKHLNGINRDKSIRLDEDKFNEQFKEFMK